jgi:hypothetical protein
MCVNIYEIAKRVALGDFVPCKVLDSVQAVSRLHSFAAQHQIRRFTSRAFLDKLGLELGFHEVGTPRNLVFRIYLSRLAGTIKVGVTLSRAIGMRELRNNGNCRIRRSFRTPN